MALTLFQVLLLALVPLVALLYKAVSQILKKKLRASPTALDDLPLLSDARTGERVIQGTAVICGGSIAGLVAARVCSNHFKEVVIIEPEAWVTTEQGLHDRHRENTTEYTPPKRSRVAQYAALHGYHAFVTLMFQQLFPQMECEYEKDGARLAPLEVTSYLSGEPLLPPYHQYPNRMLPKVICATRPVFETTLGRMVMGSRANIRYLCGSVKGLVRSNGSSNQISGVQIKTGIGDIQHISASFVVDCTGAALGGLRWLRDLPPIPKVSSLTAPLRSLPLQDLKITYDHKVAYTTCEFDVPPQLFGSLKRLSFPVDYETAANVYAYYPNTAVEKYSLLMQRREKNTIHLACGGWDVRERISSVAGIRSFLLRLAPLRPIPKWLFMMLDLFEQEDVPATYFSPAVVPAAVYVQYHRAKNLPSNFIAIGDSVMQSNPIAGQGCTKACVEAVTLNAMLARCVPDPPAYAHSSEAILPDDFGRRFFATQANRTGHLWESLKATDYGFKTTVPVPGDTLDEANAWRRAYAAAIMRLSTKDMHVAGVTYQTTNWLAPFSDVFSPVIVGKVLWLMIRDHLRV